MTTMPRVAKRGMGPRQTMPKRASSPPVAERRHGPSALGIMNANTDLLSRYPGEYVIFIRGRMVGHAENPKKLFDRVWNEYPNDVPAVIGVPEHVGRPRIGVRYSLQSRRQHRTIRRRPAVARS